jgi:hypothetical protein
VANVVVHVEIDGKTVHAGTLLNDQRQMVESATFSYADAYLRLPSAYAFQSSLLLPPLRIRSRNARKSSEHSATVYRIDGDGVSRSVESRHWHATKVDSVEASARSTSCWVYETIYAKLHFDFGSTKSRSLLRRAMVSRY